MSIQLNFQETPPKDLIEPSWLADYESGINAIWQQLVTLNSGILVLEKISAFRFDLFIAGRKHFWDLVQYGLVETCVMVVWRVGVDTKEEGLTLAKFKNHVQVKLMPEHQVAFNRLLQTSSLKQRLSQLERKITTIRHNYIAHFNLLKHINPTSEEFKERVLTLSELKRFRDTLNEYFDLLCFGNRRSLLPVDYASHARAPANFECDAETLLDQVARSSDWLNWPEKDPTSWADQRPHESEGALRTLNEYRTKFGLPPA